MFRAILIGFIRFYQMAVSPWLPPACRFTPTCSQYAREAIDRHGAGRGTWLALRRVLRCHPWGGYGFDPVPGESRPGGSQGPYAAQPRLDQTVANGLPGRVTSSDR